ncbi:hypothetical protein FKM82_011388 [Ascaphus truei]
MQMSLSIDLSNSSKSRSRPSWAAHQSAEYSLNKVTAKTLAQRTEWNAGIRPAPVRAAVPKITDKGKKAYTRTSRSSPSK